MRRSTAPLLFQNGVDTSLALLHILFDTHRTQVIRHLDLPRFTLNNSYLTLLVLDAHGT